MDLAPKTKEQAVGSQSAQPFVWVGFIALCCFNLALAQFALNQRFFPGQWCGKRLIALPMWLGPLAIASYALGAYFFKGRERFIATMLVSLCLFMPCFLPMKVEPEGRLEIERAAYLKAVQTGIPFGDQHEMVINGRKLIYWRWDSWGIDNAIGVIYDPEDRFLDGASEGATTSSEDRMAFRKIAGGGVSTSRPMGNGLYLVTST